LVDVLTAYSKHDEPVGYCQGMSHLCAVLVAATQWGGENEDAGREGGVKELDEGREEEREEEGVRFVIPRHTLETTRETRRADTAGQQVFVMFARLMGSHDVRSLYTSHLPRLSLCLYQLDALLRLFLPALHAHLERAQIEPYMFATEWYVVTIVKYAHARVLHTCTYSPTSLHQGI
jgi:hypothetical protein